MEYNVDGTHGKKSLKEHKNFYAVFLGNKLLHNSYINVNILINVHIWFQNL